MEQANKSGMGMEWDYLEVLKVGNVPVNIYLMGGIKLKGVLVEHSGRVLFLSSGEAVQLVYKHAISTVLPQ